MSITIFHIIETHRRNGSLQLLVEPIEADTFTVGRGSGCEIRFDSRLVSLLHARLTRLAGGWEIEDLNSLSGITVNGALVRRALLQPGDRIAIGDRELCMTEHEGLPALREIREEREEGDSSERVARGMRRLALANYMPSHALLSLAAVVIVMLGWFVWPVGADRWWSWSSGPIANHHRDLADRCSVCHAEPFSAVPDSACLACHELSDHARAFGHDVRDSRRCTSCHFEHHGDHGMVTSDPQLCLSCHIDVQASKPESAMNPIRSFADHPEFSVAIPHGPAVDRAVKRVSLGSAAARDPSALDFNHAVHLKPLKNNGVELRLQCQECHDAQAGRDDIAPVSFEKNCRNCHSLEFDERLPGRQVPHGDADAAYTAIVSALGRMSLDRGDADRPGGGTEHSAAARARPGTDRPPNTKALNFVRKQLVAESRAAEELLFSKTGCALCHKIHERGVLPEDDLETSRYVIEKPGLPARWMTLARFAHDAHETMQCEDCHRGARDSKDTADVLLPKIAVCRDCHMDRDAIGQHGAVASDCVQCHSFHDSLPLPASKKRSLHELVQDIS